MNAPQTETQVSTFQLALLILTLVILVALAADTIWALPREVSTLIQWTDTAVCVVLWVDFLARLRRAESKRAFLKWGWIDLVASIPNVDLLRWGRLVRVLRVIRLLRGLRSLHRVLTLLLQKRLHTGAVSLGLMAFLLVAFASISILVCEWPAEANIKTAEDAIWWSIATVTTVGYGDKYPVTSEGRLLGMFLMLAGIGMFGGLSGLVASFFLGRGPQNTSETAELLSRLEALQVQVEALTRQVTQSR